jgi:hypothetical protein
MTPNPWFLSVEYNPGTMNSLIPMIYEYYELQRVSIVSHALQTGLTYLFVEVRQLGTRQVHCAACGVNQTHADYYIFEAAPHVLRVYVQLFGHQGNMLVKLCQTWEVPENLNFTLNQQCRDLP